MVDACTVKRASGSSFNESTGRDEASFTTVYAGVCKVQSRDLVSSDSEVGGRSQVATRLEVHLPVSAAEAVHDDLLTITAAVYDSQLVGRVFRVVAPVGKSFATARRLEVVEVVA